MGKEEEAIKNCTFPYCANCPFIVLRDVYNEIFEEWDEDYLCDNEKSEFFEHCVYNAESEKDISDE